MVKFAGDRPDPLKALTVLVLASKKRQKASLWHEFVKVNLYKTNTLPDAPSNTAAAGLGNIQRGGSSHGRVG